MSVVSGNGWTMHLGESLAFLSSLGDDAEVDALVTDPPYSSGGFTRGDRMADPSKKYRASDAKEGVVETFDGDNRDQRSYLTWCALWLAQVERVARTGAPVVLFTDWRQLPTTTDAMQAGGFVWRGIGAWTKEEASRPRMGGFRADAEFFVWGSKGPLPPRVDVGCLPGTIPCPPVHASARVHLTEKPVVVMETVVKVAPPGGVVLDPFAGSASTGVACLRTGRRFVGCEKSPKYFALAVERLRAEEAGSTLAAARAGQEALFR